jgi:beta-lactamase regulating signal transducer with metallopeptidase domain
MWVWLDRVSLILFDAAFSTGLFLSVVVLAILVCCQPSRRLLIVRASLVAALGLLPVMALLPLPRVDVLSLVLRADLLPPSATVESGAQGSTSTAETGQDNGVRSALTLFKGDYAAWASRWLPRALTLIVLSVALAGTAWVLLGFWGVRWLLRHSREPSPWTQAVYDALPPVSTSERARPGLCVSPKVQRPVLVGLVRTTILIPSTYDDSEASAELLKLSLLHELAHAERSDAWFGTIASLAQSVWFFLPHVWWLRSQLIIDQEFMADHTASLRYGTAKAYASSLLSLADSRRESAARERPLRQRPIIPPSERRGAESPLFQRMLMLLHCPFPVERTLPRRWSWSLRAVVIAVSLGSACLCFRWPYAGAREQSQTVHLGAQAAFQVADFVAPPLVFAPGGRALPYHMPVALSSHFDLRVEVLSSVTDLEKIHIAGHALSAGKLSSAKAAVDPLANPSIRAESWHQIRLRRDGPELILWVDGRKSTARFNPERTSDWLTFEPRPDRPTCFRNLIFQW